MMEPANRLPSGEAATAAEGPAATGGGMGGTGLRTGKPCAIVAVRDFVRDSWRRILVISGALLAPCFWHARIEAGDLPSHTYNAWLAELIRHGQAPGLWLAPQTTNILFDLLLSGLSRATDLFVAEKIVVAAAVLLFFWSAFALVSALCGRAPWFLVPCLAMFTYGWTFEQGFMNFYFSISLAFLGLAFVARGRGLARGLGVLLLPLMWMAHPSGVALYAAGAAYLAVAAALALWQQWCLLAIAGLAPVAATGFLENRYPTQWKGPLLYRLQFNGSDQIWLYGTRYRWLAVLFLVFAVICLVAEAVERWARRDSAERPGMPWGGISIALQLYVFSLWCPLIFPDAILLPQYAGKISLLTDRATTVCAVLLCVVLGVMRPRRWHLAGFSALAAAFFVLLYQDTGKLNRMEEMAEKFERLLPPGQRVLGTIWPLPNSRIQIGHIVDRSCIGHCFSYGNYEAASGQFRVRARPGNGIVFTDFRDVDAANWGSYVVKPGDLPVYQIFQCSPDLTELCMRELAADQVTTRGGPRPNPR